MQKLSLNTLFFGQIHNLYNLQFLFARKKLSMQRSSKQAKKKRTYGCSVHHAFPVVIAVFLCFLLSQGIFENFKKSN